MVLAGCPHPPLLTTDPLMSPWTPAAEPPTTNREILMTDGTNRIVGRYLTAANLGYAVIKKRTAKTTTWEAFPNVIAWAEIPPILPAAGTR